MNAFVLMPPITNTNRPAAANFLVCLPPGLQVPQVRRASSTFSSPPSTFFSTSFSSSLSSSSRPPSSSANHVKHCLVEIQKEGCCWVVDAEGNEIVRGASLHALVRAWPQIQTLYPDVPKDKAFDEGEGGGGLDNRDIIAMAIDRVVVSSPARIAGDGVVAVRGSGSKPIEMALVDEEDTAAPPREAVPEESIAVSPEALEKSSPSQSPSSIIGKEVLTTCLDCGRGEVTLESEFHALKIVVPNLDTAVGASIFVDNSASSAVIADKIYIILPIVTCGPAGLIFTQPLRLRFRLSGTEEASGSSDDDSCYSTGSSRGDRGSGCDVVGGGLGSTGGGDGHDQRLACSHKVVMQKGCDKSSKRWTAMNADLVSEGDSLFLEASISHFCRFGLAQEVGQYEQRGGYIEADLLGKCKKKGIARFVNLSDHIATFYLQPKVFDTKREEAGGFSVLQKLSASISKRVERTALATETTLFADTVQLGPNEFGDGRLGESVGSHVAVAVTTSRQETIGRWWQRVGV